MNVNKTDVITVLGIDVERSKVKALKPEDRNLLLFEAKTIEDLPPELKEALSIQGAIDDIDKMDAAIDVDTHSTTNAAPVQVSMPGPTDANPPQEAPELEVPKQQPEKADDMSNIATPADTPAKSPVEKTSKRKSSIEIHTGSAVINYINSGASYLSKNSNEEKLVGVVRDYSGEEFKDVFLNGGDEFVGNLTTALYKGRNSNDLIRCILEKMSDLAPESAKLKIDFKKNIDEEDFNKYFKQLKTAIKADAEEKERYKNVDNFMLNKKQELISYTYEDVISAGNDAQTSATAVQEALAEAQEALNEAQTDKLPKAASKAEEAANKAQEAARKSAAADKAQEAANKALKAAKEAKEAAEKTKADADSINDDSDEANELEYADDEKAKKNIANMTTDATSKAIKAQEVANKAQLEAIQAQNIANKAEEAATEALKAANEAKKAADDEKKAADAKQAEQARQAAEKAKAEAKSKADAKTKTEAKEIAIAKSVDENKFAAIAHYASVGNIASTIEKDYDKAVSTLAELLPKKEDGSLDTDTVKKMTMEDIDGQVEMWSDIHAKATEEADEDGIAQAQNMLNAYDALKDSVQPKGIKEKFDKAATDVAKALDYKNDDGTPNTALVSKMTLVEIDNAIKQSKGNLAKAQTPEAKAEAQKVIDAYSNLREVAYENIGLMAKGNAIFQSQDEEISAFSDEKPEEGFLDKLKNAWDFVDGEIGYTELKDELVNANNRVKMSIKNAELTAPAHLAGEVAAQATSLVSATGEHVNKNLEKGVDAVDNMEEGNVKEVLQSTVAPLRIANGAVNLVGGVADLVGWALKGGEYTNEKIDKIVGDTIKQIAQEMLDDSDKSIINKKTLIDIRQRLGRSEEELEAMGSDAVEELIKQKVDESIIPREVILIAYGQKTGEILIDENGKLIVKDDVIGVDKLKKALHQFDNGIIDLLDTPSSVTGLIHAGTQGLDDLVKLENDDSALETTGKVAAQIVTKPLNVVGGTLAGVGNVASGLAKGLWALIPGTDTTLDDAGNQIAKGAKEAIHMDSNEETKAFEATQAKQTKARQAVAKDTDYRTHADEAVKARQAKWAKDNTFIEQSAKKLYEKIATPETIERYIQAQSKTTVNTIEAALNGPDAGKLSLKEKNNLTLRLIVSKCMLDPTEKNKAKLLRMYQQLDPNADPNMTADKLFAEQIAEIKADTKEQIYQGLVNLIKAAANKEDAKRLAALAENDARYGKDSGWAKFWNKLEEVHDQNEFGDDKNKFLKFVETTLLDGVLMEPLRLGLCEGVTTTDKAVATMVCLNLIGSITWMGSGMKKMGEGITQMMDADYNDALLHSGLSKLFGGIAQTALGVGLSYIKCCSHIFGKHHNDNWLGHKICCDEDGEITFVPVEEPEPVCPCPPHVVTDPIEDPSWLADKF